MLTSKLAFAKLAIMDTKKDINKLKRNAKKAASLLKALAHDERLTILCQLVNNELSVSELLANSGLSQSAFSQHLAVLRKESLVKTRKEAQTVYYSLADKKSLRILEVLHSIYCK